jgi:hypothetical protein
MADRTCIICNEVLVSMTTRVIGGYDFCRKHGDKANELVNEVVEQLVIPRLQKLDREENESRRL